MLSIMHEMCLYIKSEGMEGKNFIRLLDKQ
jgi:hypothetical protein